ncbi:MAG: LysM peptidoglycan-binding domain-containing protein [Anaerolineae bacterium]|nr:LysM peptidoglycan-binding domain-containing protein [Anaerolineae bacterium]
MVIKKEAEWEPEVLEDIKRKSKAAPRKYTVAAGDTLSEIAKKFYGDTNRWKDILEANKDTVKDANAIRVGQELIIPEA